VRDTEILVEQQPPQGVLVCDHAGLVINKFSSAWPFPRRDVHVHERLVSPNGGERREEEKGGAEQRQRMWEANVGEEDT